MDNITLDSGFGYIMDYPIEGEIQILWSLKKGEDDRYIVMEYLPSFPFRKVLQSQIHTLEDRARDFLLGQLTDIEEGKYDNSDPLLRELYAIDKPLGSVERGS
ncbi:hypothetical protein [Halobacillus sp. A5]|uniref:hypothetical protein n=1 Tax=Halobacillus sp. A5 TaxID=2880263 RepID=UPI0020A6BABF|nr:hypothetical protein [Halobacillus sp. A5]MCP3026589.1 hypothetical protein [Halobacillus sp. A5]